MSRLLYHIFVLLTVLLACGSLVVASDLYRDELRNKQNQLNVLYYQQQWQSLTTMPAVSAATPTTPTPTVSALPTHITELHPVRVQPVYVQPMQVQPMYVQPVPVDPMLVDTTVRTSSWPNSDSNGIPTGYANDNVDVRVSDVIARSVSNLAHNLGQQLSSSNNNAIIFSPLSIMSALVLLQLGSRGRSYNELTSVFHLNDAQLQQYPLKLHQQFGLLLADVQQESLSAMSPKRHLVEWRFTKSESTRVQRRDNINQTNQHSVYVVNGLFSKSDLMLNKDYRQVVTSVYNSELKQLDFANEPAQSRNHINEWVEQKTHGKISNIIAADLPPSTSLIMASALYFKAFWEQDFIKAATKADEFFPNGRLSPSIPVIMMATSGSFPYYQEEQLGCRIIGMPYRGNMTTMYVIQPFDSTISRLQQLQKLLDTDRIEYLISKMVKQSAILAFPKMHITKSVKLKEQLKSLNIDAIFSPIAADLSLIGKDIRETAKSRTPFSRQDNNVNIQQSLFNLEANRIANEQRQSDLFVDDIVHKVNFQVNEQGTEAAAATVTYLRKSGPDVLFRADSPFMFIVRHDPTRLILFYGLINQPPAAKIKESV